jgi:hypothetical protein
VKELFASFDYDHHQKAQLNNEGHICNPPFVFSSPHGSCLLSFSCETRVCWRSRQTSVGSGGSFPGSRTALPGDTSVCPILPKLRTPDQPIFLAALHGWRFVGLGFIMAYSEHLLSASFALPAAIGDMTVAFLTPWIVLRLATDDHFVRSSSFLAWNLLGIADFISAIALGALNQGFFLRFNRRSPAHSWAECP